MVLFGFSTSNNHVFHSCLFYPQLAIFVVHAISSTKNDVMHNLSQSV